MATLRERIWTEEKTPEVIVDCRKLLDAEVAKKKGVSGFAVKAAYKTVKTVSRKFIEGVLEDLVPEFCDALEPLHERQVSEGKGSFGEFMKRNEQQVTEAMLSVTDGKAEESDNRMLRKTYAKLRGRAEANVREAIPGLAALMDKHY